MVLAGWAGAQDGPRLVPVPREMVVGALLEAAPTVVVEAPGGGEDLFAARGVGVDRAVGAPAMRVRLLRAGTAEAAQVLAEAKLQLTPAMQDEGYVLVTRPGAADVVAASGAGLFYGAQTLAQLVEPGGRLWQVTVRDWPAMRYRGVHDDLSRGPFPTLAFQKHQIATLASFKVNLYSPYFEHTLQYAGDPLAAPPGGALTRAEARELAAFAADRHVTIVPEQEAFGHLHHVLKYEKYSAMAESPHGHVLAPREAGTQPMIGSWFAQIAADFPSPFLHIGADETFELGTGRTRGEVEKRGLGPVYADFLTQIHTTLKPLNRRLLFWGDVATSDPSAIAGLPKDMIAVPWIYWHQDNYDGNIVPFKRAGMETWVAPGDANWRVVYPLGRVALDNIQGFVEAGQRLGSTGELLAIWNDDGEGLFNQDWYGVLFGAAAGWQAGRSDPAVYRRAFGAVLFGDRTGTVDRAQEELLQSEDGFDMSDEAFWVDPWSKAGRATALKLLPKAHEARLHAERAIELLEAARVLPGLREPEALAAMELGARRIDFIGMKFQLADEMAAAYARAGTLGADRKQMAEARELLESISSMNGRCQDLRDGYTMLKELYRESWLKENRPYWLDNVLLRYDMRAQLWQQRGEAVQAAMDAWEATRVLAPQESLGMAPRP